MPQHKPKVSHRIVSEEIPSYSTGYQEEFVILPPEQEKAVQIESRRSFTSSLMLRLAGMCVGSGLALFFLSHYVPADIATIENFSLASTASWLVLGLLGLTLSRIYSTSTKDQTLSVDEIKSQSSKAIIKPLMSYLGWTFFFFVFGFLGPTWFRWVAAYFIFSSGANLRLRPNGFLNLTSWPAGAARFQSFKFRR